MLDYLGRAAAATVDVTQSRRRTVSSTPFRLRVFPNDGARLDADMVSASLAMCMSSLSRNTHDSALTSYGSPVTVHLRLSVQI